MLSGFKDRPQLTANTALSLSNIIVMKELLDHEEAILLHQSHTGLCQSGFTGIYCL